MGIFAGGLEAFERSTARLRNDNDSRRFPTCMDSKVLAARHTWERLLDFSKDFIQTLVGESAFRECRDLVNDHFI